MAGLYEICLEHGRNLPFNLCFLVMGIPIGPNVDGGSLGKEMNVVLNVSGWRELSGFREDVGVTVKHRGDHG